jgi:hypothetical protein
MDEASLEPEENSLVGEIGEVENTVAFGLVQEALKFNKINEEEAEFLIKKFGKLYHQAEQAKNQEQSLTRRLSNIQSDIISEKILLEKSRIEEVDETRRVQRAGETRNLLQKEVEEVEQKETMAKFELFELQRVHEELQKSLETMKKQNSYLVNPVLDKLRREITDLTDQLKHTDEAYERETAQKQTLKIKVVEVEAVKMDREAILMQKTDALATAQAEPGRFQRQIGSIETAVETMQKDLANLAKRTEICDKDLEKQAAKRVEQEKVRLNILEKLELNRQTLEDREKDVHAVHINLEKCKSQSQDLLARKLELTAKKREAESSLRHTKDALALAQKDRESLIRGEKKKRIVLDLVRENKPGLESQLKDQEMQRKRMQEERISKKREIEKLKDEVDMNVARLLAQEGVEESRKKELEDSIAEVDEMEAKVVSWLAEGKRQSKLLAVLSAQRDIKSRENSRIESKEKEAKLQVRMKELSILDLTKRCNELTNRLKEFSALYEVVKNERNKYVNLIQSSSQALAEMREKIRILQNEVEILGNERVAKDLALAKEKNSHQQAQNQRDTLRQDLNRLLSEYRDRQGNVEQQIQEIDKLNVVINSLEKEMLSLKARYEHAVEQRNITGVQLIDRNDELCILYERSNQQQEALRRGELESMKKEEELRMLRLYSDELRRKYITAKKRVPEIPQLDIKISKLETELAEERKTTEALSNKLEDPQNLDRWRPLEGQDPDIEQLLAKIKILEDRLDKKREQLLEKELVLEEITSLTEKLRTQAVTKREAAKVLADDLNDLHGKIRDITKKMLASVSELSMYQATALRLQQEKLQRSKAVDEAKWRLTHGEAPTDQAETMLKRSERQETMHQEMLQRRAMELPLLGAVPGQFLRTAAEPRPTAYIPDDLGIPRPYGNLAPFKPSEPGASMRHIRQPQIKPIEI